MSALTSCLLLLNQYAVLARPSAELFGFLTSSSPHRSAVHWRSADPAGLSSDYLLCACPTCSDFRATGWSLCGADHWCLRRSESSGASVPSMLTAPVHNSPAQLPQWHSDSVRCDVILTLSVSPSPFARRWHERYSRKWYACQASREGGLMPCKAQASGGLKPCRGAPQELSTAWAQVGWSQRREPQGKTLFKRVPCGYCFLVDSFAHAGGQKQFWDIPDDADPFHNFS